MPDYTYNTRAGGVIYVAISIAASLLLLPLSILTALPIPLWVALLPAGQLIARSWLYSLIRNAVHEALRLAEADSHIDDWYVDQNERSTAAGSILNAAAFGEAMKRGGAA